MLRFFAIGAVASIAFFCQSLKLGNHSSVFNVAEDGYVVVRNKMEIQRLPDNDTFFSLIGTENALNISALPKEIIFELAGVKEMADIQFTVSLKKKDQYADEWFRVTIAKICMLASPVNYVEEVHLVSGLINGAILRVKGCSNTSYLTSSVGSHLLFGTLNIADFIPRQLVGLGMNDVKFLHEEGRMVELTNDRFFVISAVRSGSGINVGKYFQLFTVASYRGNKTATQQDFHDYNFGTSYKVEHGQNQHAKNYVPIVHNDSIFLLPSISPLVVLKLKNPEYSGTVCHVYEETQKNAPKLPWLDEYGDFIRGGTPAVSIGEKYISFFHTRNHGPNHGMDHYYMGAMTHCPTPPFIISSMSRYPIIVNPEWYEGPYINRAFTYAVYPIGIDVDDERKYVTISIGHQDRDIFVVKMNLKSLLETLDPVEGSNCDDIIDLLPC